MSDANVSPLMLHIAAIKGTTSFSMGKFSPGPLQPGDEANDSDGEEKSPARRVIHTKWKRNMVLNKVASLEHLSFRCRLDERMQAACHAVSSPSSRRVT